MLLSYLERVDNNTLQNRIPKLLHNTYWLLFVGSVLLLLPLLLDRLYLKLNQQTVLDVIVLLFTVLNLLYLGYILITLLSAREAYEESLLSVLMRVGADTFQSQARPIGFGLLLILAVTSGSSPIPLVGVLIGLASIQLGVVNEIREQLFDVETERF